MGIVTKAVERKRTRWDRPEREVRYEDDVVGIDPDDEDLIEMHTQRDMEGRRVSPNLEAIRQAHEEHAELLRREKIRVESLVMSGVPRPWAHLRPGSAPVLWHNGRCEEVYNILTHPAGAHTLESAVGIMGISIRTAHDWKKSHPDFALAVETGRKAQEEMFAGRLARGMPYSQGLVWVLKNVHGWRDKTETTLSLTVAEVIAKREENAEQRFVDWEHPNLNAIDAAPVIDVDPTHGEAQSILEGTLEGLPNRADETGHHAGLPKADNVADTDGDGAAE